jgi:hypothetical protein
LVDETQAILKPYVVDLDFVPSLGPPHPALRLNGAAPQLHGLVLTTPRSTAQILLATPDGVPVLAAWQYGLGRSLAWTSDLTGRWGKDWVRWAEYPRITSQLIAWLLPSEGDGGLSLEASAQGGALALDASAEDVGGASRSDLLVQARLYGATDAPIDIPLRIVGPGRYHAELADQPAGAYLIQLIANDQSGQPVAALTAGAVVPLSAEYRSAAANPALLTEIAQISGGRSNIPPAESFAPSAGRGAARDIGIALLWAALLLLPFDIAVRRLLWSPQRSRPSSTQARPATPPSRLASPPREPARPPAQAQGREAELARLREEQARARRRARGEEE